MDATKKPLRIPPEFARYAEEKQIFQLLEVFTTQALRVMDISFIHL